MIDDITFATSGSMITSGLHNGFTLYLPASGSLGVLRRIEASKHYFEFKLLMKERKSIF